MTEVEKVPSLAPGPLLAETEFGDFSTSSLSSSFRFPTPEYFHCLMDSRFRNNVYEPEADTFLFLEALEKERETILRSSMKKPIKRCVEVGCGSGTVITHLHTLLCGVPVCAIPHAASGFAKVERCSLKKEGEQQGEGHSVETNKEKNTETKLLQDLLTILVPTTTTPPTSTSISPVAQTAASSSSSIPLLCTSPLVRPVLSAGFLSPLPSPVVFLAVDVNPLALEATAATWCETGRRWFHPSLHFEVDCRHTTLNTEEEMLDPKVVLSTRTTSKRERIGADNIPHPLLYLVEGDLRLDVAVGMDCETSEDREGSVFDIILFNPPYVPTSQEELDAAVQQKDPITAAWCGGPRGRVVLDRFLSMLPKYLACPGRCYLVLIRENDVDDVKRFVLEVFSQSQHEEDIVDNRSPTRTATTGGTAGSTTAVEIQSDAVSQPKIDKNVGKSEDVSPNTFNNSTAIFSDEIVQFYEVMSRYTGEYLGVYCISRQPLERAGGGQKKTSRG